MNKPHFTNGRGAAAKLLVTCLVISMLSAFAQAQTQRRAAPPAPASSGDSSLSQLLAQTAEAPQLNLREGAGASKNTAGAASSVARDPKAMAADFFKLLSEDKVDDAFTSLTKDSNLAKRERDLALFKERTRQVIDDYGRMAGHELLEEKNAGTNLLRLTFVSLAERYPLRWRLYFYKAQDHWEIIDMRVDDNLKALFQEDVPPGAQELASSGRRED